MQLNATHYRAMSSRALLLNTACHSNMCRRFACMAGGRSAHASCLRSQNRHADVCLSVCLIHLIAVHLLLRIHEAGRLNLLHSCCLHQVFQILQIIVSQMLPSHCPTCQAGTGCKGSSHSSMSGRTSCWAWDINCMPMACRAGITARGQGGDGGTVGWSSSAVRAGHLGCQRRAPGRAVLCRILGGAEPVR